MMRNRKRLVILTVVLQVLLLIGLAGSFYVISAWGEEVVLETRPIDPRDIFYGDYVVLHYDISEIPLDQVHGFTTTGDMYERYAINGNAVYVALIQDGDVYKAEGAYDTRKKAEANGMVIKGRLAYQNSDSMTIDYGLERYYVPEGTGRAIEEEQELKVKVSIAPWGQARINSLLSK